jgi:hypothetical protein
VEKVQSSKPFVPALDRALKIATSLVPALAQEIEGQLVQRRVSHTGFCVEALLAAARALGREPRFAVEMLHTHRVVFPCDGVGFLQHMDQAARNAVRHWGVTTVEDVAAATGVAVTFCQKLLPVLPGFGWLDETSGWFWIVDVPRNSLLTQIRKILVASPRIDVGELRTGVGRHNRKKGFAPPRRVLLELCRQLPWCRVDDEKITAVAPLNPREILSDSEQIILKILSDHGPVIQRAKFEELCLDAGMNQSSFSVFLSYCPLICRYATGVYGLRGAEIPAGLVESLVPNQTTKSKLLVDYGWTNDRKVQVLYRLSHGMLTNGIVSIPAALKAFVQGKFALLSGDNSKIGTLVVKDHSGWGFGPFFSRRGGEAGDYLSVMFDTSHRVATVQIGDSSLTEQFLKAAVEKEKPSVEEASAGEQGSIL